MDPQQLGARSKDLRDRIHQNTGIFLPTHVTTRVALLIHEQPVEFVDVSATQPDPHAVTGTIAIFTGDLLALVALENVRTQVAHGSAPEGDVRLTVVPRRSLSRMAIDKAEGDKNYNAAWMGSQPVWPSFGQLRLTYPGLSDDVVLGSRRYAYNEANEELDAFIPSLIADLTAR